MPDKLAAHDGDIICAGVVLIVPEKAGAVFEIGILESKLPGAVVHARNEGLPEPQRCSAIATAQSFAETTQMHLSIS